MLVPGEIYGGWQMAYERLGTGSLEYAPCRYGTSKLSFRGPRRDLDGPYVAALGGTETFGRFMEDPYPAQLESLAGIKTVNLGCLNAGPVAFAEDQAVLDICRGAVATVVEITGIQNMPNPFYSVHPRRNDRFVDASDNLKRLFSNVDFCEFHFTGHMLDRLARAAPGRFAALVDDLRAHWIMQMRGFLDRLDGRVIGLWMSARAPEADAPADDPRQPPAFVTRRMLDALGGRFDALVEVVVGREEIDAGFSRMLVSPHEEPAARRLLGPIAHQQAAMKLRDVIAAG